MKAFQSCIAILQFVALMQIFAGIALPQIFQGHLTPGPTGKSDPFMREKLQQQTAFHIATQEKIGFVFSGFGVVLFGLSTSMAVCFKRITK